MFHLIKIFVLCKQNALLPVRRLRLEEECGGGDGARQEIALARC